MASRNVTLAASFVVAASTLLAGILRSAVSDDDEPTPADSEGAVAWRRTD